MQHIVNDDFPTFGFHQEICVSKKLKTI